MSNAAGPSKGAVSTPNRMPSRKHFQGGVVTAVIGPFKKTFIVHKDLLVFYSDYFRAAFNGHFVEATEKKIELFDIEQDVFGHFHAWLYTRKLIFDDGTPLGWADLIGLWVFGDRFQVPLLQNCAMDEFFAKDRRENGFPFEIVKLVYKDTVEGSLLRKALFELLTHKSDNGYVKDSKMSAGSRHWFSFEVLQDIFKEMGTAHKNKVLYNKTPDRDKCFFHVHGKDQHC